MPRRVQDIIPGNRRSIREISIDEQKKSEVISNEYKKRESKNEGQIIKIHREHIIEPEPVQDLPVQNSKKKNRSKLPLIVTSFVLIILFAGIAFALSGHFASATFTLVPKTLPVNVNNTFIIPSLSNNIFGYEIMTLSGTASTTISATLGTYTEKKATGNIIMYNSYSSNSQRLVAGTRLASNSGYVYRLTGSITVPGFTKSNSNIIPGHVNATIIADQPGQEYNITGSTDISDFKVIAYKGTNKYDAFYGRISSDVLGGFLGQPTIISPKILASTTENLQKDLIELLQKQILSSVPNDYVTYPSAYLSSFNDPVTTTIDKNTAKVTVSGTISSFIFKKIGLAHFLAGSSTDMFGTSGYLAPNIDSISFMIANKESISLSKKTNLAVRINGQFDLVGSVPSSTLQSALAGLSLEQTKLVFKQYASVIDLTKSIATINPPWVTTVPKDLNRIKVTVNNP